MSGPTAPSEPRIVVVEGGQAHDVFEVVSIDDAIVRIRSPLLFEIGEELALRIEKDGATTDTLARVRAHVGPADARETELELFASRDSVP